MGVFSLAAVRRWVSDYPEITPFSISTKLGTDPIICVKIQTLLRTTILA